MATDESSAEQRILLATVACIERQGVANLTTRAIAKEAGVNSAAINYYFRSKEHLLDLAMATTLDHLFEDLEAIADDEELTPSERISEMLDYLIDGATRYPGVTRAHFHEAMDSGVTDSPFAVRMNTVLATIKRAILGRTASGAGGSDSERERTLDLRLIGAVSAAMLPAIMPSFYRGFSGFDFRDPRSRKVYVRSLIEAAQLDG